MKRGWRDVRVAWHGGAHLLTLALGRQKQEDVCEFEARLGYVVISRTARTTYRETLYQKKPTNHQPKSLSELKVVENCYGTVFAVHNRATAHVISQQLGPYA